MKIQTREYMAHKAQYDQLYYAYPIKGHPELTSLRTRTTHAGNQPGARQVDRLSEISSAVKTVMRDRELRWAFSLDWEEYQKKRKISHRDPFVYSSYGRTYSVATLRDYVRAMFFLENRSNPGTIRIPRPLHHP